MKTRIIYGLLLILAILVFDQSTKYLARTHIGQFETIEIMPFVNLVNVQNEGSAFGLFRSFGNTFFILISMAALVFMSWIIVTGKEDYRLFSILAGGALGNLTDRIMLGHVVDFIDITVAGFHWPAFNVADSALTLGIFLLLIKMFRNAK